MVSELEAAAIFPRRASEPDETIDGIMFLLQNSMMNAFDVSVLYMLLLVEGSEKPA